MDRSDLIARLEAGEVGRGIDAALWMLIDDRPLEEVGPEPYPCYKRDPNDAVAFDICPPFTASRDTAASLIVQFLPGWWYSSGHCHLTCHASLGPDHSDPAQAERLHKEFPSEYGSPYDSGFHADIPQPTTEAAALLHCLLQALEYNEGHQYAD